MIARRARHRQRADGNGVVWAGSGNSTPSQVRDIFGPRPFAAHIPTVGYDYDWHRGIDEPLAAGDPLAGPIAGDIIRLHRTHFGWETDAQLAYWVEADPGGSATFARVGSSLRVTGSRVGAQTIAGAAQWRALLERSIINGGDWEMRLQLAGVGALAAGKLGFGLSNETTGEYVALEWDGANATALGNGAAGLLAADGTALAVTTETWLRIRLVGATVSWAVSNDAATWVDIATQAIIAATFTDALRPVFRPILYWRSTDLAGGTIVVDVAFFGWNDPRTIDRFGNWIEIAQPTRRVILMHFQDLDVAVGDVVEAGRVVGLAGMTGFDARSGVILAPHVHVEHIADNLHDYSNDSPINPLAPGFLPRANIAVPILVEITATPQSFADGAWPRASMVTSGKFHFIAMPTFANTDPLYAGYCTLLGNNLSFGGIFLSGNNNFKIFDENFNLLVNEFVLWSAGALLNVTVDLDAQTVTLLGFDTGNGTYAWVGSSVFFPAGSSLDTVDLTSNPGTYLFAGTVSSIDDASVASNVAVTRTTANDPDAVDSWRLQIIVTRADQDLDINEIMLLGSTTSRTINFDTRAGLNADNDIPKESGVYIVPVAFDETSPTYEVSIYFNKAVVGAAFIAAYVKDTAGTIVWSE